MAYVAGIPLLGMLPFFLIVIELAPVASSGRASRGQVVRLWFYSLIAIAAMIATAIFLKGKVAGESTIAAWLEALAFILAGRSLPRESPAAPGLRTCGLLWGTVASCLGLIGPYLENQRGAFLLGLAASLVVIGMFKITFPNKWLLNNFLNTLILLLLGLPLVDLFLQRNPAPPPDLAKRPYSYEFAIRNKDAYFDWWRYYTRQLIAMATNAFEPDPTERLPFRLRANCKFTLDQCPVSLNSRGLRGAEFSESTKAFRIVALGESTTFGITLGAKDRPWPEILQDLINERFSPHLPVEVINAGVPAYNLSNNLARLTEEILPLKPDMIISYHGYNGFNLLYSSLTRSPPAFQPRPIKLLADAEFRLRVILYRRTRAMAAEKDDRAKTSSAYANQYRSLMETAHANGIQLVLANYSMAVNSSSKPEVIEFYRWVNPLIYLELKANELHTTIVSEICRDNPGVVFVDTHPALDGRHEFFIDLVHFAQAGRQQLAETIFQGIAPTLQVSLTNQTSQGVNR